MKTLWHDAFQQNRSAVTDLIIIGGIAFFGALAGFALGLPYALYRGSVVLGTGEGQIGFVVGVVLAAMSLFAVRRTNDAAVSRSAYQTIFEQSPVGYFQFTLDGQLLRVNRAFANALGYPSPEALMLPHGMPLRQLWCDSACYDDMIRRLQMDGTVLDLEERFRRKDGTVLWSLGNVRLVRNDKGTLLYGEGNLQDVTARRQAEEVYRQLVDESLYGILIFQDGHIVLGNQAASDLFGVSVERLTHLAPTRLAQLIHPDDRTLVWDRVQDRLEGKNVPARLVFQILRPNGEIRWVEMVTGRIEYHGEPGLLMSVADVTERMQAQDALERNVQQTRLREELAGALARAGTNLDAVLNTLARVVSNTLGNMALVSLRSADGHLLEPVAHAHSMPGRRARLDAALPEFAFATDHPFAAQLMTGEGVLIADLQADARQESLLRSQAESLCKLDVLSLLAVPLVHTGNVLGMILALRDSTRQAFTLQDQNLLQEVADRAALAIANAQLVRQLQAELSARQQAETRYRMLVEQIPVITYIRSSERTGEMLYVSPQAGAVLGFSQEEWVGERDFWVNRIDPADRGRVLYEVQRTRHAQLPFRAEYRLLARDGSAHWIRDEANLVMDEAHRVLFVHGIMLDITAQKRRELQARHNLEQIRLERLALKRDLVDAREHERRQILQARGEDFNQALAELDAALAPAGAPTDCENIRTRINRLVEAHELERRAESLGAKGNLVPALELLVKQYANEKDLTVELRAGQVTAASNIQVTAFRIAETALADAAGRPGVTRIEVRLSEVQEKLDLEITDDGMSSPDPSAGGETFMQARAALVDGSCTVQVTRPQGTHVRAALPLLAADPE